MKTNDVFGRVIFGSDLSTKVPHWVRWMTSYAPYIVTTGTKDNTFSRGDRIIRKDDILRDVPVIEVCRDREIWMFLADCLEHYKTPPEFDLDPALVRLYRRDGTEMILSSTDFGELKEIILRQES